MLFHQLENSLQVMLLEPVDDEAIWREQAQRGTFVLGLKRPNPGVELLLRKLRLQNAEAMIPKR